MARNAAKNDDFALEDFLQTMTTKDQSKLWEEIASRLNPTIELVAAEGQECEERDGDGGQDFVHTSPKVGKDQEEAWHAFRLLSAVVATAQATLQVCPPASASTSTSSSADSATPEGLLQVMVALHDVLFQLSGVDGEALQGAIVRVCEQWWKQERGGAEFLVAQTVPYLVARSLEEDAREALVKRVYALRGALLLLDYEEEATGPFRELLLQCFLKPTYLKSADGRRLLTFLFGLHPSLVVDIHETVKSQLPYAKKKLVQAYGDVYFRAWRAAEGPYLEAIETGCVQDLMHAAVHCASPSLYATLRLLLQSFHANKRLREVDAMLLRLYDPILWRSLRVASPTVRAQATSLLVDAFPLQDPDMGTIEAAALLQRQLDVLQSLLLDPAPHVRVTAVAGVCRILSLFWEAIPLQVTKAYVTRLVGSLAFDASSALVRLSVVEGLQQLLEQPLAHPVLKSALPLTAPLLQDKTPRVRAAFVGLLQKVKSVRDIKFYEVVPVEHLLARFATDAAKPGCRTLSARMTGLLLNSYFPQGAGVTGSKQVSRCLTFLSQSKPAALAFYGRLREHVGLGPVTRLTAMLLKCVLGAIADQQNDKEGGGEGGAQAGKAAIAGEKGKAKGKGKTARPERKRGRQPPAPVDEVEEEEGVGEGEDAGQGQKKRMSEVDEATLSGMLEVVAVLWASVSPELALPVNEAAADLLRHTLASEDMSALYDKLADPTALLQLAALCPEIFAAALGGPMTKDLKEGTGREADSRVGPIAALLCVWGRSAEVIEMIVKGLSALDGCEGRGQDVEGFTPATAMETAGKRKRGGGASGKRKGKGETGGVQLSEVGPVSAARALAMLSHILSGQSDAALKARERVVEMERAALEADMAGQGSLLQALGATKGSLQGRIRGEVKLDEVGHEKRTLMVGALELFFRLQLHVHGQAALATAQATGTPPPLPEDMVASLDWIEDAILPPALGMQPTASRSSSTPEQIGTQPPPSCGPRTSQVTNRSEGEKKARAALAQELFAVSMMVVSDWIVVLPAAALVMTRKVHQWSTSFFLPDLATASGNLEQAWVPQSGVISLLPHLCRIAHQLGLQEMRSQGQESPLAPEPGQEEYQKVVLPPSLLEILVLLTGYSPTVLPWHRYQDSHVDAARCLGGLLGLYGRLRSSRPALTALVNRLTAVCLQELGEHVHPRSLDQYQVPHAVSELGAQNIPSARSSSLCSLLVRTSPALATAINQTLGEFKEISDGLAAAASSSETTDNAVASKMKTGIEEGRVVLLAHFLALLFAAAAAKTRKALLPKVARSLDTVVASARETAPVTQSLTEFTTVLETLGEKLQHLTVEGEHGGTAVLAAVSDN